VLPTKAGLWRVVYVAPTPDREKVDGAAAWMSPKMYDLWQIAYRRWWAVKGHRLALSPEMWEAGDPTPK
jgi:hypothetical protein